MARPLSNRPGLMSTEFGHSGDMPLLFTLFIEQGGFMFSVLLAFVFLQRERCSLWQFMVMK